MLTVDLVRARQQGGELKLTQLQGRAKGRAIALAEAYLELAEQYVGSTRGELDDACATISSGSRERKLALGLRKMVEDMCEFEGDESGDARELRRQVFTLAAEARRGLEPGERFDRQAIMTRVAEIRGQEESVAALNSGLYSDLRQAHRLVTAAVTTPEALVERYDMAQAQAVLLRATRVVIEVSCKTAPAYRDLFRQLKFRRMLHTIHHSKRTKGGYRIEIDGPYSLFSSVTKYGLQLALLLPAIQGCDRWTLEAKLLWGRERRPLILRLDGSTRGDESGREDRIDLPDEVTDLVGKLRELSTDWEIAPSSDLLELPGMGLCVPDLRFVHRLTGEVVYLEVMGFWSRETVWKRVELIQAGLPHKIIFAVPKRLRVSESVLDDDLPGSLYVYRGKMSAKVILRQLEAMTS